MFAVFCELIVDLSFSSKITNDVIVKLVFVLTLNREFCIVEIQKQVLGCVTSSSQVRLEFTPTVQKDFI